MKPFEALHTHALWAVQAQHVPPATQLEVGSALVSMMGSNNAHSSGQQDVCADSLLASLGCCVPTMLQPSQQQVLHNLLVVLPCRQSVTP
jgi:hypothetical protein